MRLFIQLINHLVQMYLNIDRWGQGKFAAKQARVHGGRRSYSALSTRAFAHRAQSVIVQSRSRRS